MSATPLREALQRLAAEGLVELSPQRGARVTTLSLEDCLDVYEVRGVIEPMALRRSLERADATLADRAGEALEMFLREARRRRHDLRAYEETHRDYHRLLLSECDSAWLLRITATLAAHSSRYRFLSTAKRGGIRAVAHEHRELQEAVAAGSVDLAVTRLERHISLTSESVAAYFADLEPGRPRAGRAAGS